MTIKRYENKLSPEYEENQSKTTEIKIDNKNQKGVLTKWGMNDFVCPLSI